MKDDIPCIKHFREKKEGTLTTPPPTDEHKSKKLNTLSRWTYSATILSCAVATVFISTVFNPDNFSGLSPMSASDAQSFSSIIALIYAALMVTVIIFGVRAIKGRLRDIKTSGWWLVLVFLPVVNLLFLIALCFIPNKQVRDEQKERLKKIIPNKEKINRYTDRLFHKCPYCAEHVNPEAIKCKHCGSNLDPIRPSESQNKEKQPATTPTEEPVEDKKEQSIAPFATLFFLIPITIIAWQAIGLIPKKPSYMDEYAKQLVQDHLVRQKHEEEFTKQRNLEWISKPTHTDIHNMDFQTTSSSSRKPEASYSQYKKLKEENQIVKQYNEESREHLDSKFGDGFTDAVLEEGTKNALSLNEQLSRVVSNYDRTTHSFKNPLLRKEGAELIATIQIQKNAFLMVSPKTEEEAESELSKFKQNIIKGYENHFADREIYFFCLGFKATGPDGKIDFSKMSDSEKMYITTLSIPETLKKMEAVIRDAHQQLADSP